MCTILRVEMRVRINIADGAGVRLFKPIETWREEGGLGSWGTRFGVIKLICRLEGG